MTYRSLLAPPHVCLAALVLSALPASSGLAQKSLETTTVQPALGDLSQAIPRVAELVSPAVVSIRVEQRRPTPNMPFGMFGPFGQDRAPSDEVVRGNGSGVIVRDDGYIVTNAHVVKGATRIEVALQDGRRMQGTVVGNDPATDIAVVRIQGKKLPTAKFADSSKVRVGEWVVAIGSPFGLDYTVTAGVLSAVGRGGLGANEIEDYLQTDASINPGNSGGPLVNLRGEVLGINTMIVGRGTGIGFAVPANLANNVTQQLIADGSVRRAWLGVRFQALTPELAESLGLKGTGGALVSGVEPQSPAAQAALKAGDVIVAINGREIREERDLLRAVLAERVGAQIQLRLVRDGKPIEAKLVAGERPAAQAQGRGNRQAGAPSKDAAEYGLATQPLTPQVADRLGYAGEQGVLVAQVDPGSPAERAGLRRGDLITSANRKPIKNLDDLRAALKGDQTLLYVRRAQEGGFFTVLKRDPS